jgi:hypothetical protein
MSIPTALIQFMDRVYKHAFPAATAMAAVGVLSMTLIQAVKDSSPIRSAFQRRFLAEWLRRRASHRFSSKGITGLRMPPNGPPPEVEHDLVRLATGGDDAAFYDLPVEQMCGQISAASQIVLEFPQRHQPLFGVLAAQALQDDVRAVLNPPVAADEGGAELTAYRDARNRVTHHIQRSIDALQIALTFRWKFYLQLLSFGTSFLIAAAGIAVMHDGASAVSKLFSMLVVGLVAGFVAPIARDLVAALQQLRK